ncbi:MULTISPECIES: phosphatidate cytidylyltransferase [Anoxybacillaceae]|uniref:phosphatidate cytidylyltransferase n=1 Tax=Anoxybacillaceae TaxID=3120669 RepID=UPI0013196930|nr:MULTISPECIES: phosphatidate cytidylyltransferase [Anoxybacillus]MBB3906134.1 phosphatidate cytidylyltransferase [Anoxybacillus rupiensis]MBS2771041.1 phosphatidate cytidylyltransferase [Anoxybacillus rupiensis]QHC03713.1 phosphatidate cytidylyltransferase [Anoxybacillus sp. PDR2]
MKQRVITGVIAAALFLPIVIFGGIPFIIVTYVLATIGLFELLRMKRVQLLSPESVVSFLLLWGLLLRSSWLDNVHLEKMELLLLAVLFVLIYTVTTKNRFTFDDAAFSLLATLYVGFGFYYFMETRLAGLHYMFYALFIIWATDTGAYFTGRAFGKRKLWPEISPNKTIEGSIGGTICALVVAIVYQLCTHFFASIPWLLVVTVVLSIVGQLGDLVESAFKRHYNVKDSGNILPGHGGILDRFDSLLFMLPILHLFMSMVL